mgnify:CR=1 FL=1|tara:strand:+ start:64 stop:225 length:162 start_codon:yes stop_codon:yes gene_type:complete
MVTGSGLKQMYYLYIPINNHNNLDKKKFKKIEKSTWEEKKLKSQELMMTESEE